MGQTFIASHFTVYIQTIIAVIYDIMIHEVSVYEMIFKLGSIK